MGLESLPTYISDLNAAWPLGTDVKSAGDDHFRNIKSTLLATFPSITGAVTATHGNLNGAASLYSTDAGAAGMLADIAALADANADRILFWDDSVGAVARLAADGTNVVVNNTTLQLGSALSLTAATFSGTVGANLFSGSGASLTSLNASNLSSGSVADARLGNAALKNTTNTFTAAQTVGVTGADVSVSVQTSTSGSPWLALDTLGQQNWAIGNNRSDGGSLYFSAASNLTVPRFKITAAGAFNFYDGAVSTANSSASEVGFKGAPSRNVTSSTNTAATDAGGTVRMTGGTGQTFTLDSDPPADSIVVLRNTSGNSWTIAASGTLSWAGVGTGSRTFATGGMATAQHDGSGNWCIIGAGLS